MRILTILLLLPLFASCGRSFDHLESEDAEGTGEISVELVSMVDQFSKDFNLNIPSHLSITVVDTLKNIDDPNIDAVCWSRGGVGEIVEIKRSRWDTLSAYSKEQLLYHELGHCIMNKEHNHGYETGSTGRWCPSSIMNPYTFTEYQIEECYEPDHEDYLEELGL